MEERYLMLVDSPFRGREIVPVSDPVLRVAMTAKLHHARRNGSDLFLSLPLAKRTQGPKDRQGEWLVDHVEVLDLTDCPHKVQEWADSLQDPPAPF